MALRIATYREFWPHYLREHAQPATRAFHLAGTAVAVASLAALIFTGEIWFAAAALFGGYGPAWIGHFCVERNKPATFEHPIWSLISDYRMAAMWLLGRLDRELEKAGVKPR